jgi:hypothetical protein
VVDHDPAETIPVSAHVLDGLLKPQEVSEAGWKLLSREESMQTVSSDALRALDRAELPEIRHWRPAT